MNVAFQIEILTNSNGAREIVSVECDPTTETASDDLGVEELGAGSWQFLFVVPEDFDGTEAVFTQFERFGLSVQTVLDACTDALRTASSTPKGET